MSMNRQCRKCGTEENIRFNFGGNTDAEINFHKEEWCKCNADDKDES